MSHLGRHPEIIKLAHDRGLSISGERLDRIRDYALRKARQLLDGSARGRCTTCRGY